MKGLAGIGPVVAAVMALAVTACAPAEPMLAEPSALTAPNPNTELGRLFAVPEVTLAGKKLNIDRLRRFYARHGFAPVWTTRQGEAKALMEAVFRADDHGLPPELFHAHLLRASAALPPLDRDLLLSDAFLAYADALARGALPVERRRNDETLTPGPIDIAAALDTAIASPNPAAAIEALAPTTPTYRLLRQALRDLRAGNPASGTTDAARRQAILVNLERERWLPRRLPADRVWVNVTDQRLTMYRDDRPALSTRVIIGQAEKAIRRRSCRSRSTRSGSTRLGPSRPTSPRRCSCPRPRPIRTISPRTTWSCFRAASCSSGWAPIRGWDPCCST
jgi:hypothetical protein